MSSSSSSSSSSESEAEKDEKKTEPEDNETDSDMSETDKRERTRDTLPKSASKTEKESSASSSSSSEESSSSESENEKEDPDDKVERKAMEKGPSGRDRRRIDKALKRIISVDAPTSDEENEKKEQEAEKQLQQEEQTGKQETTASKGSTSSSSSSSSSSSDDEDTVSGKKSDQDGKDTTGAAGPKAEQKVGKKRGGSKLTREQQRTIKKLKTDEDRLSPTAHKIKPGSKKPAGKKKAVNPPKKKGAGKKAVARRSTGLTKQQPKSNFVNGKRRAENPLLVCFSSLLRSCLIPSPWSPQVPEERRKILSDLFKFCQVRGYTIHSNQNPVTLETIANCNVGDEYCLYDAKEDVYKDEEEKQRKLQERAEFVFQPLPFLTDPEKALHPVHSPILPFASHCGFCPALGLSGCRVQIKIELGCSGREAKQDDSYLFALHSWRPHVGSNCCTR